MTERKSRYELFLEDEARKNAAPQEKRCSKCRQVKPLSEYTKRTSRACGSYSACKDCERKRKRQFKDRNDWFWKFFHSRTNRVGECLEWTGAYKGRYRTMPCGAWRGKQINLRRIVYQLALGEVPDDMFVIPTCGNYKCVRQSHLQLATDTEVAIHKERRLAIGDRNGSVTHPESRFKGELNHTSKLTEDDVRQIRNLRAQGMTLDAIAMQFHVCRTNVRNIIIQKTWKHVQ